MKHLDKKLPATCVLIFAVLIVASFFVRSAAAADLSPTHSFVLERAGGDMVFSADLKWLAVGQADGKVAIWDLTKGSSAGSWPGAGKIAFVSRSNELLLAEGTNLTVRELLTGRELRRLELPADIVNSLTVSASGNVAVATVGNQRKLVFWNLIDGKLIQHLPASRYPWEMGTRVVNRFYGQPSLPISMSAGLCRAFSPDGVRFVAGFEQAQVDVWNPAGDNYNHYLGTVTGPGIYGMSTSGRAEALAFLDNQRLAVVYNRERLDVLMLNTNDADILQTLPRMSFTAKTPDGNIVTGEVVASDKNQATIQIQRLGLTSVTVELQTDGLRNYLYQVANKVANTTNWYELGRAQATNRAAAAAKFENYGYRNGRIIEAPDDIVTVQSRERAAQEKLKQHPDWSLLQKRETLIGKPGLEIHSLAVSADGRRLAVAGMRMAWRQGVFAPKGDGVYDVPVNAELQVWDAVEMKLLATIKGRSDEKFAQVALDETGGHVAAVTDGGRYSPNSGDYDLQAMEGLPPLLQRVYVWELPSDKIGSK